MIETFQVKRYTGGAILTAFSAHYNFDMLARYITQYDPNFEIVRDYYPTVVAYLNGRTTSLSHEFDYFVVDENNKCQHYMGTAFDNTFYGVNTSDIKVLPVEVISENHRFVANNTPLFAIDAASHSYLDLNALLAKYDTRMLRLQHAWYLQTPSSNDFIQDDRLGKLVYINGKFENWTNHEFARVFRIMHTGNVTLLNDLMLESVVLVDNDATTDQDGNRINTYRFVFRKRI